MIYAQFNTNIDNKEIISFVPVLQWLSFETKNLEYNATHLGCVPSYQEHKGYLFSILSDIAEKEYGAFVTYINEDDLNDTISDIITPLHQEGKDFTIRTF